MNPVTGVAERSEMAMRPPQQPESCGRCHARRGLISSDYEYGKPLTDTHMPSLLDEALYFADGQIQDEVYVYGSFLQSRMYAAGVSCSDCHNPHSLQLVAGDEPSNVCAQCHSPAKFATPEHSRHQPGDAACVDCHMPSRIYMGVDGRRDHSFRIPRPDHTETTAAPNACSNCHAEHDANWAADAIVAWYGAAAAARPDYAGALHAGRNGFANPQLLEVVNNTQFPGIVRATALSTLAAPLSQVDAESIQRSLASSDPLIRIGALRAMQLLPDDYKLQLGVEMLTDPVRGVRIEAATLFNPLGAQLPPEMQVALVAAADEYRGAQQAVAYRPEAHANLGSFEASSGNFELAIEYFEQSLAMEPRSVATRINMVDVLRRNGEEGLAEESLRQGLEIDSSSAALHHSLGLLLVRTERLDAGVAELRLAAQLAPDSSRYVYVVGIALNSMGQSAEAIQVLTDAMRQFPTDFDIAWSLATILRDQGDITGAAAIAAELAMRHPGDQNVETLLKSLLPYM